VSNLIACRLTAYGRHMERAWSHLPTIGIRHVEMHVPPPADQAGVLRRLGDCGLQASSLQARCDLSSPGVVEAVRPQLEACARFGARICLVAVSAGATPRELIWERLRGIGETAAGVGVVVAIETHPDLAENAAVSRATVEAAAHPAIRINFDTANIYFYNDGLTEIGELQKMADIVAAVHLKDSTGRPEDPCYPPLGAGVVNFPGVFRFMNERGFTGPFTMELEGQSRPDRDEAAQLRYVEQAVEYLRSIGAGPLEHRAGPVG
jgi:L-ribulose-5-phosphate 3-epimerase